MVQEHYLVLSRKKSGTDSEGSDELILVKHVVVMEKA
ncbi:UNVERIFIED_CONTAM: hypothetical protein ABID98_003483 [Brevibacillus sp. OAP136]